MIYIIQPAIPKYRIPFFTRLVDKYRSGIYFFCAQQDFLGVDSDTSKLKNNVTLTQGFFCFKNAFFWHKKLPLLKYRKDDIVVISGNPRVINYMLLFLICRLRGINTIWWGHGWSAGSRGLFSKIRIKMMHLASAVLLYTDYEKSKIGIKNCYALNNGLDSSEIERAIRSANFERSYVTRIKSLVFIGRLTEKAELTLLLKALSKTKSECRLNVIGSGDKEPEFKRLVADLNIEHRVNWFGPLFNEDEIAKVMLNSHAFIYAGSVGLSLIHAFNYGLPAIIHSDREQHMPEFSAFENEINGLSFSQGDFCSLAETIDSFFSMSNNEQQFLSSNAKNTIVQSYNVDDMVQRFNKVIIELS
ncbi:hypothetical protein AYI82_21845 [Shewanella algae]|uniref:glycosyltransferase n=1 Tax=Shewanella algae TaxID=38313 RepID=UPI0011835771|nr:glycosyltransferase [Shewanella algae]TVL01646.1 hypothetical protein AYI82_21845 [Shewanella algae]